MISVADALDRILASASALPPETVSLSQAHGRVLAKAVTARVTQPPNAVSAMDGYAVRSADVAETPVILTRVGEAPAGRGFEGQVQSGQAVRIFTGGPLPEGADCIVIQENVNATSERDGAEITVNKGAAAGRFVRPAGLDFKAGDTGVPAGKRLTARDIGVAAAMNVPWVDVYRKPRVALLATGDEIVRPGEHIAAHQIVSSNSLAIAALAKNAGAEIIDLGIAPDNREALQQLAGAASGADILVTLGGASVGEHDLVQSALSDRGLTLDFWRIAMRPGKPLMFGTIESCLMLGLPGNPVSSLVCGVLFLAPLIKALSGDPEAGLPETVQAILDASLPANDERQDYLRGALTRADDGSWRVSAFSRQDSSMLLTLAKADCLIIRAPHAAAAAAGSPVPVIRLGANAGLV